MATIPTKMKMSIRLLLTMPCLLGGALHAETIGTPPE